MKECGILSKTGAPLYWLCELSKLRACAIVCSNPRCIDQTHYTPPPPLEHRRQKPAMILFGEINGESLPGYPNVIKLRKAGLHRNVRSSFL